MKIAHLHVWDTKNKGDVAIVHAVQDLLRQTFPDAVIQDFAVDILKNGSKTDVAAVNDCDLVVIGGGGIYCRYFLPFSKRIVRAIKRPMVIFAVGFGNEIGAKPLPKRMLESIVFLNNRAILASVRDQNSYEILRNAGYTKPLHLIGDAAILLEGQEVSLEQSDSAVGFNINYSGWLGFGKYQDKILAAYRECIDNVQEKYNATPYYLVHHPGEYEILERLDRKIAVLDLTAKEQKYAYSKLDLSICMMLHAAILNFAAGTPMINVAYDAKNIAFAKFIGHGELAIHPEELEPGVLWSKAQHVIENSAYYKKRFEDKKIEIQGLIGEFLTSMQTSVSI